MTAVASLDRNADAASPPVPNEEELLDVLYEVLAQGVPPRSSLTREEVERFLHEHARESKPVSEMVRFFERHSLPTHPSLYGADHALGELASGLQKEHSSIMPGMMAAPELAPPPVQSATETGAARALGNLAADRTGKHAASSARRNAWESAWAAMTLTVAVALVLLGGFVFSYERSSSLELRLEQARMQQRSTDGALTKLEQQTESLRTALQQSEQERRATTARLEGLLAEQKQRQTLEALTLERILGQRYRNGRDKLASELAATQR